MKSKAHKVLDSMAGIKSCSTCGKETYRPGQCECDTCNILVSTGLCFECWMLKRPLE